LVALAFGLKSQRDPSSFEVQTSEILAQVWHALSPADYLVILTQPARFTLEMPYHHNLASTSQAAFFAPGLDLDVPMVDLPIASYQVRIRYRHTGRAEPVLSSAEENDLIVG
jgi:hypothetical protein